MTQDKQLPQAKEIEELILGAILINPKSINQVLGILPSNSFFDTSNRTIYDSMLRLNGESKPIDLATVVNQLNSDGKLSTVGGASKVVELTNRVVSSDNIEYHSRIVLEKYIHRKVIEISHNTINNAYKNDSDALELLSGLSSDISAISLLTETTESENFTQHISSIVKDVYAAKDGKIINGIKTPLKQLNERFGGWQDSDLIIMAARPAMGKLQPLTEPVLTPNGWDVMGNIKKGSEVICPVNGTSAKVLDVYPQDNLKIYKITFNDGSYTECCNEHLWKIQESVTGSGNRPWKVVDTQYMIDKGVTDKRNKSKFRIPLTNAVEFNKQKITLHPYLLGLFIADGYLPEKNQVTITCHNDDAVERLELIKTLIPDDVSVKLYDGYDYTEARRIVFSATIKPYLKELGLLGKKSRDKFVPNNYIYNSVDIRKELLSALLDTDGTCFLNKSKTSKQVSYSTMSDMLKSNVVEIVKSLGGKASATSETREKYKGGFCYNIAIKTPFNPFTLDRKKETFDSVPYYETFTKTIREISFLRYDKGQCISVDSNDHLYITRDYTVTHNTALALQLASYPVFFEKKKIMMFSLEMSAKQLTARVLSQELEIPANRFTRDATYMDLKDLSSKLEEREWVYNNNFIIDDRAGLDVNQLVAKVKTSNLDAKIDMVVIDYLQLLVDKSVKGNREQEISSISRKLKGLAKDLNIPVIALSQLSRSVESRGGDKIPMLSDLRESGAIEQDADIVIFLHRPEYYGSTMDESGNSLEGKASIITAKYRAGGVGTDVVQFDKKFTKFKNEGVDYFENDVQPNTEFEDSPF